jgi:hypothetical protein
VLLNPEHWVAIAVMLASVWLHTTADDNPIPCGDASADNVAILASVLIV